MDTISILVRRASKRWAEKRKAGRNTDTANGQHTETVKQKAGTAQNEIQPEKNRSENEAGRPAIQSAAESPSLTTTGDKEQTEVRLEKFLDTHSRFRYNVQTADKYTYSDS